MFPPVSATSREGKDSESVGQVYDEIAFLWSIRTPTHGSSPHTVLGKTRSRHIVYVVRTAPVFLAVCLFFSPLLMTGEQHTAKPVLLVALQ